MHDVVYHLVSAPDDIHKQWPDTCMSTWHARELLSKPLQDYVGYSKCILGDPPSILAVYLVPTLISGVLI